MRYGGAVRLWGSTRCSFLEEEERLYMATFLLNPQYDMDGANEDYRGADKRLMSLSVRGTIWRSNAFIGDQHGSRCKATVADM
nr:hypothetical protein CFP56_60674 [Quercus suber]